MRHYKNIFRLPFHFCFFMASMIAFLAITVVSPPARAGTSCAGAAVVKNAARDLMRAGRSGSPARIRRALDRHVNMRRVMSFALGRNIRHLRGKQRQHYYRKGSEYAARKLASLAREVQGRHLEILRCRGNHVETRLLPDGERIIWKLRSGRIVDVNFRGVWMALLLRDHFRRLWRRAGNNAEAFLAQLN